MNHLSINTVLPNGDEISTVRLEGYSREVYETCIFFVNGDNKVVERYDTQKEAIEGHVKYCQHDWWASL